MIALLESGEVASQAEIALREGITRARVTQIMGMLRLAPEIRENILSTPNTVRQSSITERVLRPIATITDYHDQIREFRKLLGKAYRLSFGAEGGTRIPAIPPLKR